MVSPLTEKNGVESLDDIGGALPLRLTAAYSISRRFGVMILDYIAVSPELRKSGIGSILLDRIKEKCRELSEKKIYLTAKARGFFLKNGAREIGETSLLYSSLLGECAECDQRGRECFPSVMELDV